MCALRARFVGSERREGEPSRQLILSMLGDTRAQLGCVHARCASSPENIPLDTRTMLGDVASLARCATPRGQLGEVRRSLLYLAERPVTRRCI